jgi:squalene synthase HpnC
MAPVIAARALSLPPALPDPGSVMDRAGSENFPVALCLLGKDRREQLLAIYGFARLVDEVGDEYSGDRLAALDWLERELERAFTGQARHPLLQRLQATLARHPLPHEPLQRLIEANRMDQRVSRYRSFEQLCEYCALSANPVGELVLAVFDCATPQRVARSNEICTALQLAEHWQDVAEDDARGRVYLPSDDLERFGVTAECLRSSDPEHRARMRQLMRFEVRRARELLSAGAPLLRALRARPKLAVAAFIAGGRAALEAIERSGFEVLDGAPRADRLARARAFAVVLVGRSR